MSKTYTLSESLKRGIYQDDSKRSVSAAKLKNMVSVTDVFDGFGRESGGLFDFTGKSAAIIGRGPSWNKTIFDLSRVKLFYLNFWPFNWIKGNYKTQAYATNCFPVTHACHLIDVDFSRGPFEAGITFDGSDVMGSAGAGWHFYGHAITTLLSFLVKLLQPGQRIYLSGIDHSNRGRDWTVERDGINAVYNMHSLKGKSIKMVQCSENQDLKIKYRPELMAGKDIISHRL